MQIGRGIRVGRGIRFSPTAIAEAVDEFFRQTVLLVRGNSTNDGTNNTFIDESPNALTVTRNGNTTQGSFSPFSVPEGYWSNYFDGNGDYLTAPNNSAFQFGTGDFTIESWVYIAGNSALNPDSQRIGAICSGIAASSVSNDFWFVIKGNSTTTGTGINLRAWNTGTGVNVIDSDFSISQNTWHHIAVTRSGNTIRLFFNGALQATATYTGIVTAGSNPLNIGYSQTGVSTYMHPLNGYLSNFRIVKGTAVYTAAFTPQTTPLTSVQNTVLLTCQSNRFRDDSTNNFTLTRNGDVRVTSFGPYAVPSSYSIATNGGSGYFDGNGDYLSSPNVAALRLGAGDFTVEAWIYPNSVTNTYASPICGTYGYVSSQDRGWGFALTSTGKLTLFTGGSSGAGVSINSTDTIVANTWTHVAAVRSGTTVTLYINGVANGTVTNTKDEDYSVVDFNIATSRADQLSPATGNAGQSFRGNISNLRIVKGTAVYTGNFTPPSGQLFSIAGTSLLLNFTNGNIVDLTSENNFETIGDAKVNTSVTKFNPGSLYFDGNGDYLLSRASNEYDMGTGNFTVECWAYPVQAKDCGIIRTSNAGSFGGFAISFSATSRFKMLSSINGSSWAFAPEASFTSSLNTWHHVAMVRNGSTMTLYVNGVSAATGNIGTSSVIGGLPLYIGWANWPNEFFNGYLDDIRITKGVARYTSNFTPPTERLPSRAPAPSISGEFIGFYTNVSDASSYSFTTDTLEPGLIAVVALTEGTGSTATSISIGGTAATVDSATNTTAGIAIGYREITSSTTSITVNFNTTTSRCAIGVYRLTGYTSTSPIYTSTAATGSGTYTSTQTLSPGFYITGVSEGNQGTIDWSAGNFIEDFETTTSENFSTFSSASLRVVSGGSYTVAFTPSSTVRWVTKVWGFN